MNPCNAWLKEAVQMLDGRRMPQIQLGVYLMSGREASQATRWALEAGYRGIDSAQMYRNERDVGRAINAFLASPANAAQLKREDIHFTSKLASNSDYATARKSIAKSVRDCELGYIDLYLLHSPYGGKRARLESWRALEDAVEAGEVRSAGVSNFGAKHIKELLEAGRRKPAVNQIEVHPFNTHAGLTGYCADEGIVVEAYAPLVRAMRMTHPTIKALAGKYGCEPAQLLVRWSVQKKFVTLPKSARKERIASNAEIGHFEISDGDMAAMDGLDEQLVTDWDPLDAD